MSAVSSRITRPDSIDDSCRWALLKLVLGALAWLLLGLALRLGASVALHQPTLGGSEYLGYGKLAAAARVALTYGFALPTAFAVGIWLLFKLAEVPLKTGLAVAAGAGIWHVGVATGVVGIIIGDSSGIRGFEFPAYTGGILLAAYFLIGLAVLPTFGAASARPLQLPQVMVLAAMLWFPWLLATAQVLLVWFPVRGVLSALIGSWYSQGLFWGCLTPITLASLLHFRCGFLDRTLPRPDLAKSGFWSLLLLAGWTGASTLVGGPVPAWIASVGVVVGVLLIIPVVLLGLNLLAGGMRGAGEPVNTLASLSALSFVVGGVLTSLTALRCANRILHFTFFAGGLDEILGFGFVFLGLMAALYVILPRLVGFGWHRSLLNSGHIGLSVCGFALLAATHLVGGWVQGYRLDVPNLPLNQLNHELSIFLKLHSLGVLVFLGGQALFVVHLALVGARHFPSTKQFLIDMIEAESFESKATQRVVE